MKKSTNGLFPPSLSKVPIEWGNYGFLDKVLLTCEEASQLENDLREDIGFTEWHEQEIPSAYHLSLVEVLAPNLALYENKASRDEFLLIVSPGVDSRWNIVEYYTAASSCYIYRFGSR